MKNNIFISEDLVQYLRKLFPNKLPNKRNISENDIAFLQGQQSVIERMELMLENDQPEEI
jgi:hypothetical protein|tara:strand:+ start:78 stop:257 length:180 start_codon:yes stop_codon:yes gene_type:complete